MTTRAEYEIILGMALFAAGAIARQYIAWRLRKQRFPWNSFDFPRERRYRQLVREGREKGWVLLLAIFGTIFGIILCFASVIIESSRRS